jgi:MFS family permease
VGRADNAYLQLLRSPAVRGQALAGLIAQVTQGSAAIGIILVVRAEHGSVALGGAVAGALSIAAGLARPVQGRLIDRRGPKGVIALCGVLHAAALIGVVVLAEVHAPGICLVAAGALAGVALPPISTSMRVIWGTGSAVAQRTAAYSLVYLTQELSILTGPLLLAVLIAAASAQAALIAVAAVAGAGTLGYAALAGRSIRPRRSATAARTLAALRPRAVREMVCVAALIGATLGGLEVAVPIFATEHGAPAASGLLIATLSIGGIVGAVVYGSRHWASSPARRLAVTLALLTGLLALAVGASTLAELGALLLLAGLFLNPSLTTVSLLVDRHVEHGAAAEAFGWLSLGIAGGTGLATAIAGVVAHRGSPTPALIVAAAGGAAATLLAVATNHDRQHEGHERAVRALPVAGERVADNEAGARVEGSRGREGRL